MIIHIQAPKLKKMSLTIRDNSGHNVNFKTKRIMPRLWKYQRLELETLIDNSDSTDLRISTHTTRWFLRDLIKNPTFICKSIMNTYCLHIENEENICLPIHISAGIQSDKIWISRNAVKYGLAPSNLDESLEYDRLRNPGMFHLLILFAENEQKKATYELFESTQFGVLAPNTRKRVGYFTDYEILHEARVVHGKVAIQKDKIVQISNRRFELIRRSPGWIEARGDKFQVFKPFSNIGEVDKAIFFGSNLNWFHFIVECLTRFVGIPSDLVDGTPIILESSTHKNIQQICKLLTSTDPIILKPGEEVSIKSLIIGREFGVVDTIDASVRKTQLKEIRERILSLQLGNEEPSSQRIYLRRPRRLFRPLQNEKRIVRLLSRYGFVSIYPENESIQKIIEVLNSAELIVVESGAAITNLIFANKDLKVLELNPGDGGFGFWSRFLDNFEIRSVGIVGERQLFGSKGLAVDGYRIPVKEIEDEICEMLGKVSP